VKIDWTKVKEGFTTMDVLKEENKELKNRIDKVVNDMKETLERYNYYDNYSVDASMIIFWVEMLLEGENNE
jgi:heme oxygenase